MCHALMEFCVIISCRYLAVKWVFSFKKVAKMWKYYTFTLFNLLYIQAFNVDTESPIILTLTSAKSLFGHSISILENGAAIIGAPESETHGNVFLCQNITHQNLKNCEKVGE